MGGVGLASGAILAVVLAACAQLLGRHHLGRHVGSLNLGGAMATVMVLPLLGAISDHPQGLVSLVAGLCVALALTGGLLRRSRREP
jgi:predicted MFS family arabinose efflux permease